MMIKLFCVDIDGTLTDGIYHTTEKGEISKNFFTRDFHGMWMLDKSGVKICIITAGSDNVIDHQLRRGGGSKYADVIKGTYDKRAAIEKKYISTGINWNEVAYVADDIFDIGLLSAVGLCSCPSDAAKEVAEWVDNHSDGFVSNFPGGKGCVREFSEYVLDINKVTKS
jgi:3-deoxy-D-manno-octulosonate 8-phosphate phosphatase (KDO 8-P phosphatase)